MRNIIAILVSFFIATCAYAQTVDKSIANAVAFAKQNMFQDAERVLGSARQRAQTPAEVHKLDAAAAQVNTLQMQWRIGAMLQELDKWAPLDEFGSCTGLVSEEFFARRGESMMMLENRKGAMTPAQKKRYLQHVDRLFFEFDLLRGLGAHAGRDDIVKLFLRVQSNFTEEQKRLSFGAQLETGFPVSEGDQRWYFTETVAYYVEANAKETVCFGDRELDEYRGAHRKLAALKGEAVTGDPVSGTFLAHLKKGCMHELHELMRQIKTKDGLTMFMENLGPRSLRPMLIQEARTQKRL